MARLSAEWPCPKLSGSSKCLNLSLSQSLNLSVCLSLPLSLGAVLDFSETLRLWRPLASNLQDPVSSSFFFRGEPFAPSSPSPLESQQAIRSPLLPRPITSLSICMGP